jgi:hypothetical protein
MEPSSVAIFDPHAFYPFRSLVQGGLQNWNELQDIERFVRAIVLHDEMSMILEPWPYDPLADEEMSTNEPGARNIIVGMGPVLSNYEGLLSIAKNLKPISEGEVSSTLRDIAAEFSNARSGNPYYNAHIEFVGKILAVSKDGGSIICEGRFSRALELRAAKYPEKLFQVLDKDWQEYAMATEEGRIGVKIPPILNIILTNCKKREDIPDRLKLLREEWTDARKKLWRLLGELRNAQTLKEAHRIQHELAEASKYFSPLSQQTEFSPVRMLWDLFAETGGGAIDSALAGGDPAIGAVAAAGRKALTSLAQSGKRFGKLLFGRGAFDLARSIRKEVMYSSPKNTLSRLLTQSEKDALGL